MIYFTGEVGIAEPLPFLYDNEKIGCYHIALYRLSDTGGAWLSSARDVGARSQITQISARCCSLNSILDESEPITDSFIIDQKLETTSVDSSMATKVYIVYYSMYGHVAKLAEEIKKGAASVEGVEAKLWQVPETLNDEVLAKMSAPPKSDVPIITPNELPEADGFIFGFPTRYGMMAAQFKSFFDATGGLWRTQQLASKPAGIFYSTGSQGGGQETTALTAITQLVHHGMIFVPIGYTFGSGMFEMEKVKGGSPYGAGTYAGDGSRQPSELELQQAFHQGKHIATITKKLKGTV
ncbi:NAD(P)H dehydrogenase (quinone) FQR1-like [Cynara cardunculus var. scolymus]|uniref:NAD(P)H dehydrogenase (quinone) FQR1-like n=1 Tax=Cynara cardunculus var. scolymus TaxID=59895 RepID=UPI000D62D673|nr:NAD(P)H dehydrogenase (quinone) FQR1-like [Cynara cardunculus var. scolymus]